MSKDYANTCSIHSHFDCWTVCPVCDPNTSMKMSTEDQINELRAENARLRGALEKISQEKWESAFTSGPTDGAKIAKEALKKI